MKEKRILFYDIETSYLTARVWALGEQFISHTNLVPGRDQYDIICLSYAINNGPIKTIDWGFDEQNSKPIIEEFDRLVESADIVIGKNNTRFDDKHINTLRLRYGLPGTPDWSDKVDDLERHMRKTFYLPSNSLDYFSNQLGLGGKIKMDMSDWVNIVEKSPSKGIKALKKMIYYNKKDVRDTRTIWQHCVKHFTPKFNASVTEPGTCKTCGSINIAESYIRQRGKTLYQYFTCLDHNGYAGKLILKDGIYDMNKPMS